MADYTFITTWKLEAPVEQIWQELIAVEQWPSWWRGVEHVQRIDSGGQGVLGTKHLYTWKSVLPYRLSFAMRMTRMEPLKLLEGRAEGELEGFGRWTLTSEGPDLTTVRYYWQVRTTKAWMNLLTPLLRPLFRWNHDVVMGWGGQGLAQRLGVALHTS
jgi:uncharacterized protein YndB with AHSA1/START domain